MKIKLLAPLLGLLLLSACSADEEPEVKPAPEPQNLCYLQEQTIVSGTSNSTIRYAYNDLNQVIRTERYEQQELTEVRTYTYTAEGKLAEERLLTPDEQEEISFTVYSYNPQGRLSKYEVKQRVPELEAIHRIASFKTAYDQLNRLTTATDYRYLDNREVAVGSVTQTYPRDKPVVATVKGLGGETLYAASFVLDSARRTPLSAVPVFMYRKPGVGYPNTQNIIAFRATTGSGETLAEVKDVAYTAAYTYNDQGYPLTAKITYAGEAGRTEEITYTYNCQD
ncbi:hypothetical protein [Pontibacter flavimaris]|uniref:DUF4595 domain-containing protein n=1 Tax=Pontibacter flavimaris TaxID=1797110 RepID=A0A1Q5PBN6_9BACT|nr:hypothetical protein [Pontibacter flavimaris]OKL39607.1 hypothetical protein A3841_01280 [Pontibacter flavimaris]